MYLYIVVFLVFVDDDCCFGMLYVQFCDFTRTSVVGFDGLRLVDPKIRVSKSV